MGFRDGMVHRRSQPFKENGITLAHIEQGLNEYVDLGLNFRYFFARKTMFLKYSQAFICLPGGMGTMDEFLRNIVLRAKK